MNQRTVLILLACLLATPQKILAPGAPRLDRGKPIQMDLWSGPPAKEAFAKLGMDNRTVKLPNEPSEAYRFPMLIRCILSGNEAEQPFAVPYESWCSHARNLAQFGGNCPYAHFRQRQTKEELLELSCRISGDAIPVFGHAGVFLLLRGAP